MAATCKELSASGLIFSFLSREASASTPLTLVRMSQS